VLLLQPLGIKLVSSHCAVQGKQARGSQHAAVAAIDQINTFEPVDNFGLWELGVAFTEGILQ
jgi:hypothetical protein